MELMATFAGKDGIAPRPAPLELKPFFEMTIALETVSHDTFTPFIGHVFIATVGNARAELELSAVQVLGHKRPDALRDPFSLTFRGAPGLRLPQGIHRLVCEGLGEIELFIAQNAGGSGDAEFEAIFT